MNYLEDIHDMLHHLISLDGKDYYKNFNLILIESPHVIWEEMIESYLIMEKKLDFHF